MDAVLASPLRRAQETAAEVSAVFKLPVETDDRLRERMNWVDDPSIDLDRFLAEWKRATDDRSYRPPIGHSSIDAAARFIEALTDLEGRGGGAVVVVAHGGVTVDVLRTIAGDASVGEETPHSLPAACRAAPSRVWRSPGARSA
jgi:broad specificity phosphatase PhoE